jgi:hypothetical protein
MSQALLDTVPGRFKKQALLRDGGRRDCFHDKLLIFSNLLSTILRCRQMRLPRIEEQAEGT